MKNFFTNIFNYIKAHKIIAAIVVVAVIGGVYYYHKKSGSAATVRYVSGTAQTKTITVSVDGTGQIAAANEIQLKPSNTGTTTAAVTSVNVTDGQAVKTGDVIATIDERAAINQINSAKASLEQAQSNYDTVVAGTTSDDQQLAQLSLQSAQTAVQKAQDDYKTTVTAQQNDVIAAQTTLLNTGLVATPSDQLSTATVSLSGTYTGTAQGTITIAISQTPSGYDYIATGLGSGSGIINRGQQQSLNDGLYMEFSTSGEIAPSTQWTISIPNQASNSYNNNLVAYNNALTNQTQALKTAQQAIDTAQTNLQTAQIQYNQKIAPPTQASVDSARSQLTQAQTNLSNAETAYSDNIITAPFDGVVANLAVQKGDQVTASTVIGDIITPQQIAQISLNEVDAVNVKVGQKATMTFDAIDGLTMTGSVVQIDTIGTVSQGVTSYNAKVALDTEDARIKPGMNVSVSITTNVATDVLTVPSSAVKSDASGSYVQQLVDGKPQDVSVQTGLSDNTDTQITSGLTDGEQIITQTITTSATTTSSSSSSLRIPGVTGTGGGTGFGAGGFGGGGTGAVRFGGAAGAGAGK